jgi:hypothetical protein
MKTWSRKNAAHFAAGLGAVFLFTTSVGAQEQPWRGFYVGGGGGYSTVSVEMYGGCYGDCGWWGDYPDYDEGDGDYGYALHAGYRLNRYLALEANYIDAGTITWKKRYVYLPEFDSAFRNEVQLTSTIPELAVVGILPFARRWEAYVRLGAGFWDGTSKQRLEDEFTGEIINREISETGVGFLAGVGIGVNLAAALHVRFDFQSVSLDGDLLNVNSDTGLDSMLLELQYRFGARAPVTAEPSTALAMPE